MAQDFDSNANGGQHGAEDSPAFCAPGEHPADPTDLQPFPLLHLDETVWACAEHEDQARRLVAARAIAESPLTTPQLIERVDPHYGTGLAPRAVAIRRALH